MGKINAVLPEDSRLLQNVRSWLLNAHISALLSTYTALLDDVYPRKLNSDSKCSRAVALDLLYY